MKENHLEKALQRTIEEETTERQRQKEKGYINPTILIDMANHRRMLENNLDYEECTRMTIPTAIISTITSPIGLFIESILVYGLLKR